MVKYRYNRVHTPHRYWTKTRDCQQKDLHRCVACIIGYLFLHVENWNMNELATSLFWKFMKNLVKFPKLTYWWTWNLKFKVPRTPNPNHTWFANCVAGSYGFVGGANGCVCGSYSWWILQFSSWILRFIVGSYSCVVCS